MLLFRWVLSGATLLLVSYIVPGFVVTSVFSALIAALILGLVNAFIRPLLLVLTLPITILTLGLFTFVINALMLQLTSKIVKGFDILDFRTALLGALVLTLIGWMGNYISNKNGK